MKHVHDVNHSRTNARQQQRTVKEELTTTTTTTKCGNEEKHALHSVAPRGKLISIDILQYAFFLSSMWRAKMRMLLVLLVLAVRR